MSSPDGKADPDIELPVTAAEKADFIKAIAAGMRKPGAAEPEERPPVEVLRRIPAPEAPAMRSTPESVAALDLAAAIDAKFQAGELEALTPEALQALMAALCRYVGAASEAGVDYPLLPGRQTVSGTDVMIMCGALLKAVDLQVFELGMWQSWSGQR